MTSTDAKIKLSLSEFLELPETKPASEYINGRIYQKPMPKGKHSTLQIRLGSSINQVALPQQIAHAFTELRCTFGGRSIVPDICVFEWQRIPINENGDIENRFEIYPDWVIEILSPEQPDARLTEKNIFCLNNSTKLGWLIDPEARLVIIFKPQQQPEVKQDSDILPVLDVLENWQLSATELFQWLSFKRN